MSAPANGGIGNLSTLLKRLEAATSRLEDIATAQAAPIAATSGASAVPAPGVAGASNAATAGAAAGIGAVAGAGATAAALSGSGPMDVDAPPAVKGYEELIEGPLAQYLTLSTTVGGLVADQAQAVSHLFSVQKDFIALAAASTKLAPTSPAFLPILTPTQTALQAVQDIKEKNRASKQTDQLSVVSEGIAALGWVTLESKPGPFVGEMKESAQFWANRVVKQYKETDKTQVDWARSFISLLEDLRKYIMQYHTTGLTWNPKGGDPTKYKSPTSSSTPAAAIGGAIPPPPPPPPGPPPPPPAGASPVISSKSPPAADMGGVFAALNQGEGVTKGLKKVDKSEMTHKNPELRAASVVPATIGKGPVKPPKPSAIQKKPAKTELEGIKWMIENHENNPSIAITQTEINQIVNIFNVKSSVVQIKGKVNAISLVNCNKVSILLESTVSSLSISSSPSFTVQILGKVPTILIDGTDGGQIYLSKESLDVEIVTAKTSSINVSLPVEGEEEGIFEEKAVPEQLKTVVKGGKLVTTVVEHSG